MYGRPNPAGAKTMFTLYLTEDEMRWLRAYTRRLQSHGDYCMSDVCRAGLVRMIRGTKNQNLRWLKKQIDEMKGGQLEATRCKNNATVIDVDSLVS